MKKKECSHNLVRIYEKVYIGYLDGFEVTVVTKKDKCLLCLKEYGSWQFQHKRDAEFFKGRALKDIESLTYLMGIDDNSQRLKF